ncbi:MAG: DNA processing protein DprA [Patescibacteria group bacterium]|nr:MAG: DNA processing protein DprA [Patescibacteria group bacterium]
MNDKQYWLGFSVFQGIGPKRFSNLIDKFDSAQIAWKAPFKDLKTILGEKLVQKFDQFRSAFSPQDYEKKLQEKNVFYVTRDEETYPALLKQLPNPPIVLYIKGNHYFDDTYHRSKKVGVVGTRRVTVYGEEVTRMFTADLVSAGCIVISGLALGVDAIAHSVTLANDGKTIAVLGCGVDCCYPLSNKKLYDRILDTGGTIISEYPLGVPPSKGSFPSRNRIIAGLADAVLVTEGSEDSGALITAREAMLIKRKVFVVPGPITSKLSEGPYKLHKDGAILVTSPDQLLDYLSLKKNSISSARFGNLTKDEQEIIAFLENEELTFDQLSEKLNKDAGSLGTLLTLMELKQIIFVTKDGRYSLQDKLPT